MEPYSNDDMKKRKYLAYYNPTQFFQGHAYVAHYKIER